MSSLLSSSSTKLDLDELSVLKLPINGTNTKGYCKPLLLWYVITCTHWASVSKRIFCASADCVGLWICSPKKRTNACSPWSDWAACCKSSPRCSTLLMRRSPLSCANKRLAIPWLCNQWCNMAKTPCCCHIWRHWWKLSNCVSHCNSFWVRFKTSSSASAHTLLPMAARTHSVFLGVATARKSRQISMASGVA